MSRLSSWIVLSCLVACSGGGSSHAPAPSVQVGSVNALAIAGTVLDATMGLAKAGDSGVGVLTAIEGEVAAAAGAALAIDVRGLLARRLHDLWLPRYLPVLVNGSETGIGGGTATYLWDDRDDNERLSSGDTFEIVFEDFVDETGVMVNGWLGIERLQVMGNPAVHSTWSVAGRMKLGNFTVAANGATTTLAGAVDCGVERRPTVLYQRLVVVEPLLTNSTSLLPASTIEYAEYDADATFRIAGSGAVSGAGFGGIVTYTTTAGLGGFASEANPSHGVIKVLGSGVSVLTITVLDSSTVQIEIDADGDGEADETQTVDWLTL